MNEKLRILIILCSLILVADTAGADIESNLKAYYNFEYLNGISGEAVTDQSVNDPVTVGAQINNGEVRLYNRAFNEMDI